MCSGEACNLCGAGCWNSSVRDCNHDVIERHMDPPEPAIEKANALHNEEPPCSEQ